MVSSQIYDIWSLVHPQELHSDPIRSVSMAFPDLNLSWGLLKTPVPLSQQFSVLQRKGEGPSRPFPPSPVTLCKPACLCTPPPHEPLLKGEPSSRALLSTSSITFNFSLPGLLPRLPRSAGVVPKIHLWSFSYEKISESVSWGTWPGRRSVSGTRNVQLVSHLLLHFISSSFSPESSNSTSL